jgi:methionyl-tRNA formyltransferase
MNIIYFTQEDPFYVKVFFDEYFKQCKSLNEIKAIVISRPMGKKSVLDLARQMYNFYGFYDFLRMGIKYAHIKVMGKRPVKRAENGSVPRTYTLKQLAELYGVQVIERSDINTGDFRQCIKEYNPDLFISVASPIIFKKELIALPKLSCINIHNAPLPKYRGMLPNFWQLYHGEQKAGITIHRIAEGIDTGDIVAQHFVSIELEETLHDLIVKTKKMGARFMVDVIEDYRQGKVTYRKMEGEGSYFTFPKRKDVKVFKRIGRRLL